MKRKNQRAPSGNGERPVAAVRATWGNRLLGPEGRFIRMRMGLLCGLLAAGLGVVAAASYHLTMVDGSDWRKLAQAQRERRLHVRPKRGTLYDRNGSVLAVSVDVPTVSVDAVELLSGVPDQRQPEVARDAAQRIARALDLDPARVERKILRKRRYAFLKRNITAEEAGAIRQLGQRDSEGGRIRGLVVDGEGRRYYPSRELAAPLLGFVAPDGEGKDGVELVLDEELSGELEQLRGLRDRNGRLLLSEGVTSERAFAGHDVNLTIDVGIQHVAERELALAARTYEAKSGSVVVVQPDTGEILAMASWPGYNPNDYGESAPLERRNRAIADRFEPGSTMKIFTVAIGLAQGEIKPTERLYCEKGHMAVDNIVIRDTHPAEWLTVSQVLAQSSNICAAKIGLSLGGDALYEGLLRFGFGQPTDVGLAGESSGILRPRNRPWVQVETASAAFGQGISVTTLQLAMATAAVANGGKLLEPRLVRRVTSATGEVIREATPRVRRIAVPERAAATVAEMMVAVTEGHGTGVDASIEGFQVAGKTATAQKIDPATGRYSLDNYIASFVGFVPARNPAVAIAVTIDEPMVAHSGGEVAAPVFREVAKMALKYKGLTPGGSKPVSLSELARQPDPANATYALMRKAEGQAPAVQEVQTQMPLGKDQVRVPDMTGWPLRRALVETRAMGVLARVRGHGLVSKQVPSPGQVVDKGGELVLHLEPAS